MKTRIISGAVLIAVIAAVLTLSKTVSPYFITVFIAAAAALAAFELIRNAAKVSSSVAVAGSMIYVFIMIFLLDKNISSKVIGYCLLSDVTLSGAKGFFLSNWNSYPFILSVVYFVFAVFTVLKLHKQFPLERIAVFSSMPIFLSYAFSTLGSIINHKNGIYYLLLLLNFSAVCDTGAYFVGSTLGKHKLCPEISPKKTVEGALGGIISSVVVALILVFAFSHTEHIVSTLLLTVPMCILGMFGDLFASAIKRSAGIKDYGTLIPGHGGILDRFDSILMIAPVLYIFESFGVI